MGRRTTTSKMLPNDRPIVAGSARAKAQQAKRLRDRAKPRPKRVTTIPTTSTSTSIPRRRGFTKLKSAAEKRAAELEKIK